MRQTPGANPPQKSCGYRLADAGRRPPPWLALPPLLAISRCFAGSIAAKPRFDPPLLVGAIMCLPSLVRRLGNAEKSVRFTKLMEVKELLLEP